MNKKTKFLFIGKKGFEFKIYNFILTKNQRNDHKIPFLNLIFFSHFDRL